jgi:hypothetical protein
MLGIDIFSLEAAAARELRLEEMCGALPLVEVWCWWREEHIG